MGDHAATDDNPGLGRPEIGGCGQFQFRARRTLRRLCSSGYDPLANIPEQLDQPVDINRGGEGYAGQAQFPPRGALAGGLWTDAVQPVDPALVAGCSLAGDASAPAVNIPAVFFGSFDAA